mmetsp:Transcript_25263/g.72743  ORF Transcript_25263/g.72743 Transcript_25263/m.72743 type:complete len:567 (-) Transcript_25263:119-1819(-)
MPGAVAEPPEVLAASQPTIIIERSRATLQVTNAVSPRRLPSIGRDGGAVGHSRTEPRMLQRGNGSDYSVSFMVPDTSTVDSTSGSRAGSRLRKTLSQVPSETVGPLNSCAIQSHAKRLTRNHVVRYPRRGRRRKSDSESSAVAPPETAPPRLRPTSPKLRSMSTRGSLSVPTSWTGVPRTAADARRLAMFIAASTYFEAVVGTMLIANAMLIGAEANYNAKGGIPDSFRAWDIFFCVFFCIELGLRLFAFRWSFFATRDWWNHFDALLVLLQVADECAASQMGPNSPGLGDISVLRLAKILRLFRILRFLRLIRFVSELRKVMYLVIGSIMSFVWTGILLLLLLYTLGVFFTQIVADYAVSGNLTSEQMSNDQALKKFFGSTFTSLATLYKAITGGFDWIEVSHPLEDNVSPFMGFAFAMYTAFAVLVLLNLVTGVFVDGALKVSRSDKEIELLEKAYSLFACGDEDSPGEISWDKFRTCLSSEEAARFFEALEISQALAEDLFQLIDQGQGTLTLEELVAGGLMLQGPAKAIDVAGLSRYVQAALAAIQADIQSLRRHPLGSQVG